MAILIKRPSDLYCRLHPLAAVGVELRWLAASHLSSDTPLLAVSFHLPGAARLEAALQI
jgi:hypothetical protein